MSRSRRRARSSEDELGFRLFERVKGRLVPTPEADELFPVADRLFGDLDNS